MNENKRALRQYYRTHRAQIIERHEKDALIAQTLSQMVVLQTAQTIGYYVPYEEEVCISLDIFKETQTMSYPYFTAQAEAMVFLTVTRAGFEKGVSGIERPIKRDESQEVVPDVMFVPMLAFNKQKYRLGYGGGFYDRYLAAHPSVLAIGLAYEAQLSTHAFQDDWDIPLDRIVTEERVYD